jgi:hypothetical protein
MTKSDLAARPVFHRLEDSIQAHLTVVFAALTVSREAQTRSGLSINKILKTLRPLRSATVTIGTQQVTAQPRLPRRNPNPPDHPRLEWSLNRYNSGPATPADAAPRSTQTTPSWRPPTSLYPREAEGPPSPIEPLRCAQGTKCRTPRERYRADRAGFRRATATHTRGQDAGLASMDGRGCSATRLETRTDWAPSTPSLPVIHSLGNQNVKKKAHLR